MAYEMVMPYHLHMPSYFLETFTEYPHEVNLLFYVVSCRSILFGYNHENSYLTTLPEVFPCINSSTSSTVT